MLAPTLKTGVLSPPTSVVGVPGEVVVGTDVAAFSVTVPTPEASPSPSEAYTENVYVVPGVSEEHVTVSLVVLPKEHPLVAGPTDQ